MQILTEKELNYLCWWCCWENWYQESN